MTVEERLANAMKKVEQYEHQQLLQKKRNKEVEAKIELRRKILIGEMFIKHFPIALEFTPGKTSDEDSQIFEPLDEYMETLAECQQAFQNMEEALIQRN